MAQRQRVPGLALARLQGDPRSTPSPLPPRVLTASKQPPGKHLGLGRQCVVQTLGSRPHVSSCRGHTPWQRAPRPPAPGLPWIPVMLLLVAPPRPPPFAATTPRPPARPQLPWLSATAPAGAPGREPCPCVPFAQAGQALGGRGQTKQALQCLSSHSGNPAGQAPARATSDLRNGPLPPQHPRTPRAQQ